VRQLHSEGKLEGVRTRYGVLVKPESVVKLAEARAAQKGAREREEARSPAAA
jgi:hypothetical protein